MKSIFLSFLTLLWVAALAGQTNDTTFISIGQENGALEQQQVMNRYDQVFGTLESTRWMFSLNLPVYSGSQLDIIRAGAEVKLSPAVGLHASYGIGVGDAPVIDFRAGSEVMVQRFGLEPRWYYAMPRHIREGKSANNMSGNYIGLAAVYNQYRAIGSSDNYQSLIRSSSTVALRYGLQRRLFRYGFLDIGFGMGVVKNNRFPYNAPLLQEYNLFANAQVGLGLALARPKASGRAAGYCDVLRCFQEERQMWKIDLYNLIRVNSLDDYKGQLSIAYERKIADLPLTLEVQGAASHERVFTETRSGYYENRQTEQIYSAALQARYYYTQSQRIARGKSGNNLSGVYMGAQLRYAEEHGRVVGFYNTNINIINFNVRDSDQKSSAGLLWGIQHRLFENGFIDFYVVGSAERVTHHQQLTLPPTSIQTNFHLAWNLRAGFAF